MKNAFFVRTGRAAGVVPLSHSLFLQVVSHLLVFVFRQLLVAIVVVLSKDGLNLCIRVALPEGKDGKAVRKR